MDISTVDGAAGAIRGWFRRNFGEDDYHASRAGKLIRWLIAINAMTVCLLIGGAAASVRPEKPIIIEKDGVRVEIPKTRAGEL